MSDWTEVDGSRSTGWIQTGSRIRQTRSLERKVSQMEDALGRTGELKYMERLAADIVGVLFYLEQGHIPSDLEPLRKAAQFLDPKVKLDVYADGFEIEI